MAGPARTLLPLSARAAVATLYEAGPASTATAAAAAATGSAIRRQRPLVRRTKDPNTATAAATGITTRSAGAKPGVRASSATAIQAVAAIARPSTATPAHERRAQPTSITIPAPARAAIAGASALT